MFNLSLDCRLSPSYTTFTDLLPRSHSSPLTSPLSSLPAFSSPIPAFLPPLPLSPTSLSSPLLSLPSFPLPRGNYFALPHPACDCPTHSRLCYPHELFPHTHLTLHSTTLLPYSLPVSRPLSWTSPQPSRLLFVTSRLSFAHHFSSLPPLFFFPRPSCLLNFCHFLQLFLSLPFVASSSLMSLSLISYSSFPLSLLSFLSPLELTTRTLSYCYPSPSLLHVLPPSSAMVSHWPYSTHQPTLTLVFNLPKI